MKTKTTKAGPQAPAEDEVAGARHPRETEADEDEPQEAAAEEAEGARAKDNLQHHQGSKRGSQGRDTRMRMVSW